MSEGIAGMLKDGELAKIRRYYDGPAVSKLLKELFVRTYPSAIPWAGEVETLLFEQAGGGKKLGDADRERCLVAILASRGSKLNLAIHMYMAIAIPKEGVSPSELCHILAVTGIYTGVDNFADSLKVAQATLGVLKKLVGLGKVAPRDVLGALQATFEPPPEEVPVLPIRPQNHVKQPQGHAAGVVDRGSVEPRRIRPGQ